MASSTDNNIDMLPLEPSCTHNPSVPTAPVYPPNNDNKDAVEMRKTKKSTWERPTYQRAKHSRRACERLLEGQLKGVGRGWLLKRGGMVARGLEGLLVGLFERLLERVAERLREGLLEELLEEVRSGCWRGCWRDRARLSGRLLKTRLDRGEGRWGG
ncbi:hypothetical protein BDZ91DRAFT_758767 [Kalaharituber pfeilii]|nr:hypothetical protein BDZ91DRAFT_758767 [Kalaharituber pfeilii]